MLLNGRHGGGKQVVEVGLRVDPRLEGGEREEDVESIEAVGECLARAKKVQLKLLGLLGVEREGGGIASGWLSAQLLNVGDLAFGAFGIQVRLLLQQRGRQNFAEV